MTNEALKKASSKEISNNEKSEALAEGIMYGSSEIVEALIKGGALVNDETYYSVCSARHFHLLKLLMSHKEPTSVAREKLFLCAVEQDASDSYTALASGDKLSAEVIGKGYLALLKEGRPAEVLASLKPSLAVKDDQGRNALHWAVMREDKELAQKLIKLGADKKAKDSNGMTPADYAKEAKIEVPGL